MSPDSGSTQVKGRRRIPAIPGLRQVIRSLGGYFAYRTTRSLASRILLLQFVWVFLIYVLVIAALWVATNMVIVNSVKHQAETWVAKLDEMGIPIYAANDPAQLNGIISYLRNFHEVASAQYLDSTGTKILADYARKDYAGDNFVPLRPDVVQALGSTDAAKKHFIFEKGGNSKMRISAPIWVKSITNDGLINYSLDAKSEERIETIGFINIVLDYSQTSDYLNRNIFYASVFIALMMVIAAFIARTMIRRALRPLSDLEEPLTRLANGETDVTVSASGDEEIARIGAALNTTIKALKERDETLRQLANHDALTGLANRKYFIEQMEHEITRISSGGGSDALFFFDLDRFKNINDTYGHAAGDRLLVQLTRLLNQRIRESDLIARFGGDEFTLLAYGVDHKVAGEIAESFIRLMQDFTFHEGDDMLKIYFSIGVTVIDNGKLTAQDYLKEADAAVHQAKSLGRNCYRIFVRGNAHSDGAVDIGWYERLQEVLHKRQIILYYQPLADLRGRQAWIHEAFLRLPDSKEQVLNPSLFMPAAERFGLMADFDRLVIELAARALAERMDQQELVSVNLSAQFFAREDVVEFLEEVAGTSHLAPSRLIFEIPAHFVVRNLDKLQLVLTRVAQHGYRIAIDDFGNGFLSFDAIKYFPVHFLKIDGTLIERICSDRIAQATVRAIVDVADAMGIQTVAKNVVDDAGVDFLRELGVGFAQGNHIAAPSPGFNTGAGHARDIATEPVKLHRSR